MATSTGRPHPARCKSSARSPATPPPTRKPPTTSAGEHPAWRGGHDHRGDHGPRCHRGRRGVGGRGRRAVSRLRRPAIREQDMGTRRTQVSGLAAAGSSVTRYGLVTTVVWIGVLKFTDYEVQNAEPLVTASLTSRL